MVGRDYRSRKEIIWIFVLCLAVFIITLAYAFGFRIPPSVDAKAYDNIAWNLVLGNGYQEYSNLSIASDPAIGRLGPGYEYFLAGIYTIFGHHLEPVWIIQSILHMLCTGMVLLLASRILPESPMRFKVALFAAALYGFHPDLIQIAAMLMTETLFLASLLLSILGIILFADHPTAKTSVWVAAVLAVSILIRPVAILLVLMFLAILVLKKKPAFIPLVLLLQVLIIGPWTWRNYSIYNQFVLTTAAGGYDLWVGNSPGASGELEPSQEITEYLESHGILEADRYGIGQVWKFLISNPVDFIKLQLVKTMKFFSIIRTSAWWWHLERAAIAVTFVLSAGFTFILFILGLRGLWSAFRDGPFLARVLAVLALAVPLSVIPIVVETRYRYAFYPFLAILSALAIWRMREGGISRRSILVTGGCVFAVALLDLLISSPQIPERILRLFA